MANTINKKMLDLIAENFQKEFEAEQSLLEKMWEYIGRHLRWYWN